MGVAQKEMMAQPEKASPRWAASPWRAGSSRSSSLHANIGVLLYCRRSSTRPSRSCARAAARCSSSWQGAAMLGRADVPAKKQYRKWKRSSTAPSAQHETCCRV